MNKFIEFLDSYKNKDNVNYSDIVDIMKAIDIDFNKNCVKPSSIQPLRKIIKVKKPPTPRPLNNYDLWKTAHEVEDSSLNLSNLPLVNIDANVESIDDIIKLINDNPLLDDVTYNIDLRSLHKIKSDLVELNDMIGMDGIKDSVINQLVYFIQKLHLSNDHSTACIDYKHTVICGPPGTGKTEIAQIIGRMYSKIGILKKNVFRKVTRSDLVAGYLGQTAMKTKDVIESCLGGCLFIDEAYALANDDLDSYSKECIDTLCEALSNHKDNLMVIIAGYEEDLNQIFFPANKGLESRFIWKFRIDSYDAKELCAIFVKKVRDINWSLESDDEIDYKWFEEKKANFKHFGRDVEMLLSCTKVCHSRRIFCKDPSFRKKLNIDDINKGYAMYLKNKNKKEKPPVFGLYV